MFCSFASLIACCIACTTHITTSGSERFTRFNTRFNTSSPSRSAGLDACPGVKCSKGEVREFCRGRNILAERPGMLRENCAGEMFRSPCMITSLQVQWLYAIITLLLLRAVPVTARRRPTYSVKLRLWKISTFYFKIIAIHTPLTITITPLSAHY